MDATSGTNALIVNNSRIRRSKVILYTISEMRNEESAPHGALSFVKHTRHRSIDNFAVDLFAGLIAYNLLPKELGMNIAFIDKK